MVILYNISCITHPCITDHRHAHSHNFALLGWTAGHFAVGWFYKKYAVSKQGYHRRHVISRGFSDDDIIYVYAIFLSFGKYMTQIFLRYKKEFSRRYIFL